MKQKLVVLTISFSPAHDITPLLLEALSSEQIQKVSLLDGLSPAAISAGYEAQEGEESLVVQLPDGTPARLSTSKVEQGLQQLIGQLEARGAENILLLGGEQCSNLQAENAALLAPDRLIPPLVSAMVAGYQAGIVIPAVDPLRQQAIKWRNLNPTARFAVATPKEDSAELIDAGLQLLEQGADVVVLDGPGYLPRHGDLLEKMLGIPVLLSYRLLVKMAAELLA